MPAYINFSDVRRSSGSWSNGLISLPASDLEEDTGTTTARRLSEGFNDGRMPGRQPGHLRREPVDESTESPSSVFDRVFSCRNSHTYNGTDYYKSEENRLSTFVDWKYQWIVRKEDLARNGFIYTGSRDKVRCVFCGIILRQWEPSDVVEQEHRRNSARCPFLRGEDIGNIALHSVANGHHDDDVPEPMSQSSTERTFCGNINNGKEHSQAVTRSQKPLTNGHHIDSTVAGPNSVTGNESSLFEQNSMSLPVNPQMVLESERLASFSTWPPQMMQKPEQLALSGLYYTGDGDKVKCFHCDVTLYNWEPTDDPIREHARWYPNCQYLRLLKGDKFVEDVQNHRMTEDEVMKMPAVEAVLLTGYSKESIQRALDVLREGNVEIASVSAELLMETIMDLEQPAEGYASYSRGQAQTEDFQLLQRENESLREKQQCKICMERDVEVIFYPCKHIVCCVSCSAGISLCPVCRVNIESRDKVFMA